MACNNEFPTIPTAPTVLFPGGIEVSGIVAGNDWPTPLGLATSLLAQTGPALAGLSSFFKVLDVLIALFDCIKAIPESIASLNPEPIISSIVALTAAVAEVVKLIPQLSIPVMIVNLIDLVILALRGILAELTAIASLEAQATALVAMALEIPGGGAEYAACVTNDAAAQLEALSASLGPIGKIIELMNLMTTLAGLPEIPALGSFTGSEEAIEQLNAFISTISDIRGAIPI